MSSMAYMDEIINLIQYKIVDIGIHKIYIKMTAGHTECSNTILLTVTLGKDYES